MSDQARKANSQLCGQGPEAGLWQRTPRAGLRRQLLPPLPAPRSAGSFSESRGRAAPPRPSLPAPARPGTFWEGAQQPLRPLAAAAGPSRPQLLRDCPAPRLLPRPLAASPAQASPLLPPGRCRPPPALPSPAPPPHRPHTASGALPQRLLTDRYRGGGISPLIRASPASSQLLTGAGLSPNSCQ